MKAVTGLLDACRDLVREFMTVIARGLNTISGGKLHPNVITIIGFLAHIPIALLIGTQHNLWAGGLLIIFGLFDALDGALARLQKRASNRGMLLDATTDKMKETMLYTGAAYSFVALGRPYMAVWAVIACGASLCVSYVKAKGEVAVKDSKLSANEINRLFQEGLGRFEIRMAILVVGLLSGRVILAVVVIAILSTYTAFERLIKISKKLA